jgi:hypothetical protein
METTLVCPVWVIVELDEKEEFRLPKSVYCITKDRIIGRFVVPVFPDPFSAQVAICEHGCSHHKEVEIEDTESLYNLLYDMSKGGIGYVILRTSDEDTREFGIKEIVDRLRKELNA